MQNISQNITTTKQGRGGRISSLKLRASLEQAAGFIGLEEDINRYDLLLLVKRIGKYGGFSPRMITLLDYYMSFTRDIDWEEGSSPIIYQSLSKTALDMGISERQIQKLEKSLFEAGALTWHDSGNHRRYGKRDSKSGIILYAYGVDLTPLSYLKPVLESKLQEKRMYDEAWMETKRQISWYRSQIRAITSEMVIATQENLKDYSSEINDLEKSYNLISIQIRTHLSLETLRDMLQKHKGLYKRSTSIITLSVPEIGVITQKKTLKTQKSSSINEKKCLDNKNTNNKQSNKLDTSKTMSRNIQNAHRVNLEPQKEVTEDEDISNNTILKTGLQHITLKQALNAASENFRAHMPLESRPMNWNDFISAAYKLKTSLSINQGSWANACTILGRSGAAICLLLTEQATCRQKQPVKNTGAYFNAMINRAKKGELRLHNSIFGILKREYGGETQ